MNQIKINIINSNIEKFKKKENYVITLPKFLNCGTYGYVFTTNYDDYCVKILLLNPHYDNTNELVDYDEIDVIDRIISTGKSFEVVNSEYCYGKIIYYSGDLDIKSSTHITINKTVNEIPRQSYVEHNDKVKKFVIYEENYVIIMPRYFDIRSIKIKTEEVCKKVIKSVDELMSIDLINIDIKRANYMLDINNNIKMIDMGMIRNKDKMDKPFKEDGISYYTWPIHRVLKHKQLIPYMISIFMLELKFPHDVYEIKSDYNHIMMIIKKFMGLDELPTMFKDIINKALTQGLDYEIFSRMVSFV
jgi:hypothetical protein